MMYICPRCNYVTTYRSHILNHWSRKKSCKDINQCHLTSIECLEALQEESIRKSKKCIRCELFLTTTALCHHCVTKSLQDIARSISTTSSMIPTSIIHTAHDIDTPRTISDDLSRILYDIVHDESQCPFLLLYIARDLFFSQPCQQSVLLFPENLNSCYVRRQNEWNWEKKNKIFDLILKKSVDAFRGIHLQAMDPFRSLIHLYIPVRQCHRKFYHEELELLFLRLGDYLWIR